MLPGEALQIPSSSFYVCSPSDFPDVSFFARSDLLWVNNSLMSDSQDSPPYNPAVTSARRALRVSRAIILRPIAAWIGTSNSCLGITLSTGGQMST